MGHYNATEHRLVNHCITGVFGQINETDLTTGQLKLQEELRMQNAVWIGQGMAYQQRKPLLDAHAAAWIDKQAMAQPSRKRAAIAQEKAA